MTATEDDTLEAGGLLDDFPDFFDEEDSEDDDGLWDDEDDEDDDLLTHRRPTKQFRPTDHVVLFAESGNEHFGDHVWVLEDQLPPVSDEVVVWAAEYYNVSEEEAEDLVDPSRIVSSAGAWDDEQFVSDLWQAMENGEVEETPGYRTADGAVVLSPEEVSVYYYLDDDDDDDEPKKDDEKKETPK